MWRAGKGRGEKSMIDIIGTLTHHHDWTQHHHPPNPIPHLSSFYITPTITFLSTLSHISHTLESIPLSFSLQSSHHFALSQLHTRFQFTKEMVQTEDLGLSLCLAFPENRTPLQLNLMPNPNMISSSSHQSPSPFNHLLHKNTLWNDTFPSSGTFSFSSACAFVNL